MSNLRNQIIEEARSWIGTPFSHQGHIKGYKIDCVSLARELGVKFNILDTVIKPEYIGYSRRPDRNKLKQACEDYLVSIPFSQLLPADLLLIQFEVEPAHIAIYNIDTIIHASTRFKKCDEHPFSEFWKLKVTNCYRYPGLVNE